jgi:hypothetical protein
VGLAQREIEGAGIATITLSNVPDLTAAVGVPRIAAIEYPFGRNVGQPGDREGQMAVLRATLQAAEEIDAPGSIKHLPFEWPEPATTTHMEPPQPPPIVGYLIRHPWHVPRLLSRDVPQ